MTMLLEFLERHRACHLFRSSHLKVVGFTQTYATRPKGNVDQIPRISLQPLISLDLDVDSCNSVLGRLHEPGWPG